jgi:hypothetical protein
VKRFVPSLALTSGRLEQIGFPLLVPGQCDVSAPLEIRIVE